MREGNWYPVRWAAPMLGYTEQGLRKKIATHPDAVRHREEIRGNKKRLLVWVDAQPEAQPERNPEAELRARVEHLERTLAAKDAHLADLRAELDAERRRVDRLIAALADPRVKPGDPARPWPGLRAWWRRVWEGEGG